MVVIMKPGFTQEQLEAAIHTMEEGGVQVMVSKGAETTILGAEGNAAGIDQEKVSLLPEMCIRDRSITQKRQFAKFSLTIELVVI